MNYTEIRSINVNTHIEKKNGLSYLSWAWAVDTMLQHDPSATWEFPEPKYFGETVMVFCNVTAFGKTMKMQLPVMDNRNQAIKNPDAVQVNKAMMRCLAKAIACFGIGLYIYSGEDLPSEVTEPLDTDVLVAEIKNASTLEQLQAVYASAFAKCGNNKQALDIVKTEVRTRKAELEKA